MSGIKSIFYETWGTKVNKMSKKCEFTSRYIKFYRVKRDEMCYEMLFLWNERSEWLKMVKESEYLWNKCEVRAWNWRNMSRKQASDQQSQWQAL